MVPVVPDVTTAAPPEADPAESGAHTAGLPLPPEPPASEVAAAVDLSPAPLCSRDIDAAMKTGSAAGLTDAAAIARCASDYAGKLAARQEAKFTALFGAASSEYAPGINSQFVTPVNIDGAQPFIVGDQGNVLASLSTAAGGRSAAYGVNVLDQFHRKINAAHVPAFRRLLSWLLQGDAAQALPASVRVNFSGIDAGSISNGFAAAGVRVVATACDFSVPGNCGGNGAQLLVLGSGVPDGLALETQTAQLLASGLPVLYVHTKEWDTNAAGRKMLAAMGMVLGAVNGNFYIVDAVAPGRSAVANVASAGLRANLPLLEMMAADNWRADYKWPFNPEWRGCAYPKCEAAPGLRHEVLAPAERLRSAVDAYAMGGRNLFAEPNTTVVRLLVLWADVTRKNIKYPMDKTGDIKPFLRAAVADSLVAYVRPQGGAQPDLGTFMKGSAAQFDVSRVDEVITVQLPTDNGFTALGRFAVPGKTLTVQVVDAKGASLSLQLNTQRWGSTQMWNKYERPRFLASPKIALGERAATQVTSPYGGLVQLSFTGATPGTSVQLRVSGVARQPFVDGSAGADLPALAAAIDATPFDWVEIKLPGFEVHSRTDVMKKALAEGKYENDLVRYFAELRSLLLDDAYGLAGFAIPGRQLPAAVMAFCARLEWNCADEVLHRMPVVQHFTADLYAHSGLATSGNPIDLSFGLAPRGWIESHELGHNLEKTMLSVYFRRSVEVANNLFALHKRWPKSLEWDDSDDDRMAYKSAFEMIKAARSEADPVQGAYGRIWASDAYAAQSPERLAFYMQWVHYWSERMGDNARGWDILTQLYLHQRLFEKSEWASVKNKLGYGRYANRPKVDGNDNLLIALSWMTQRDQRPTFDLWGITYSKDAAAQVQSHGFASEPAFFYANTSTRNHDTVRKVDMTVASPAWPF